MTKMADNILLQVSGILIMQETTNLNDCYQLNRPPALNNELTRPLDPKDDSQHLCSLMLVTTIGLIKLALMMATSCHFRALQHEILKNWNFSTQSFTDWSRLMKTNTCKSYFQSKLASSLIPISKGK
jgi:hypothetical protein